MSLRPRLVLVTQSSLPPFPLSSLPELSPAAPLEIGSRHEQRADLCHPQQTRGNRHHLHHRGGPWTDEGVSYPSMRLVGPVRSVMLLRCRPAVRALAAARPPTGPGDVGAGLPPSRPAVSTARAPPSFATSPQMSTPASGTLVSVGERNWEAEVMRSELPVIVDCYAQWYAGNTLRTDKRHQERSGTQADKQTERQTDRHSREK